MTIKKRITKLEEKVIGNTRSESQLLAEAQIIAEAERKVEKMFKQTREQDN